MQGLKHDAGVCEQPLSTYYKSLQYTQQSSAVQQLIKTMSCARFGLHHRWIARLYACQHLASANTHSLHLLLLWLTGYCCAALHYAMSRTTANAGPAQLDTTNEQANVRQKVLPLSSFHVYRYTDIICWKNLVPIQQRSRVRIVTQLTICKDLCAVAGVYVNMSIFEGVAWGISIHKADLRMSRVDVPPTCKVIWLWADKDIAWYAVENIQMPGTPCWL